MSRLAEMNINTIRERAVLVLSSLPVLSASVAMFSTSGISWFSSSADAGGGGGESVMMG